MLTDEQLKGKYIKYVPEITEEIFNKILDRAKGIENTMPYNSFKNDYNSFKNEKYFWFKCGKNVKWGDNNFSWGVDNNSQDCTEISYKDIIGEQEWWEKMYEHAGKPVDVTTNKLPEKNLNIKDLIEGEIYLYDNRHIALYPEGGSLNINNNEFTPNEVWLWILDIKSATAEEKQWLKVCIAEDKFVEKVYALRGYDMYGNTLKSEVIPKYVECIKSLESYPETSVIGRIYKVTGELSNTDWYIEYDGKRFPSVAKNRFKLSTKEAYEAQFMPQQPKAKEIEKSKFEVGKWYKNLGDGNYVGKLCGEVTDSRFPCKEYLNRSGAYTSAGTYFIGFEKAVEAAYEDYGEYLPDRHPDRHPDKIIKKEYMNTMNIEVGDTVKCVSEKGISKFGKGNNGAGWESNLEFIVARIDNHGEYNIYFRSERGNGVYSDAITLVKRKEQSKSFQVHDKCNIGDIIVTTEVPKDVTSRKNGDLHQVLQKSDSKFLYYGTTLCIGGRNKDTYRLATPEEVKMYNDGIRNINDVKKEENYKVGDWCYVISAGTSQLEKGKIYRINEIDPKDFKQKHHFDNGSGSKDNGCWLYTHEFRKATAEEIANVTGNKDFVLPELWCIKVTSENKDALGKWREAGELSQLSIGGYCVNKTYSGTVGYFFTGKPSKYTEITFEQFKKYVLKENASEGEKVNEFVEGQWYKHVRSEDSFSYYQGNNKGCGFWKGVWKEEIITSNPSEWKSCTINDVKELLFDEARTRYPLGCEYNEVSGDGSTTSNKYKPTEIKPYIYGRNSIALQELKGLVYTNGVWAVVVSKGSSEEITSYDGLKVGDVLPEKVISDWAYKDYNWICLDVFKSTWGKSGGFIGDRYIESFKEIQGEMCFLVSGTKKVYLKAKGFKSFMESYAIKTGKGILEQIELASIHSYEPWKGVDRDIFDELRKDYGIFDEPVAKESYKRKKLELKKFNVKKLV